MEIGYTPVQEATRAELRSYYDTLLDDQTRAELADSHGVGPAMRGVWKQMCADGWAGVGWPTEYGGKGLGPIEQFIFFDESMRAGAPVPMLTINTVGPTLMNFGDDAQREFYLPKILAGDIHFCIGYSEPQAGSDLAALATRAVRDGDEYVITGNKMWTSLSSDADYCWLAVRTGPSEAEAEAAGEAWKKHKGISIIIVPMDTPGITISPLHLIGEHDINAVFFDGVRVPVTNCVGGENNGWTLITNQLNHERVTLCSTGVVERAFTDIRQWAADTKLPDGRRVIDQEWVQLNLAKVFAELDVLRLMNWQVGWEATQGKLDVGHCSAIKVFGTEYYLEAFRLLMEVLGPVAYLEQGTPGAVLASRLEMLYRGMLILTFGGGTNELQRDLITMFSLGFPRAAR
jgi:alkylation response protein AidB-like acyl-CoA dehydrogenase